MRVFSLRALMSSPPMSRLLSMTAGGRAGICRGGTGTGLPMFGAWTALEAMLPEAENVSAMAEANMQRGVRTGLLPFERQHDSRFP